MRESWQLRLLKGWGAEVGVAIVAGVGAHALLPPTITFSMSKDTLTSSIAADSWRHEWYAIVSSGLF
jgi:hypothetical protein